jgi:hypothetical protein
MAEPARDWLDDPDNGPSSIEQAPEVSPGRSIDHQVRGVANQRGLLADLESVWRQKRQAFEDSNADIVKRISDLKKEVHEGEETLKALALTQHKETGELKLAPGVKIRRVMQVDYDAEAAIGWCKEHDEAAGCLKLDITKFNSLAKALTLPFVHKETVSQVTLAKDLDAALKAEAA